jgi:hypothetical protein
MSNKMKVTALAALAVLADERLHDFFFSICYL